MLSSEVKDRLYKDSLNGPSCSRNTTSFGFDSTKVACPEILEMRKEFLIDIEGPVGLKVCSAAEHDVTSARVGNHIDPVG